MFLHSIILWIYFNHYIQPKSSRGKLSFASLFLWLYFYIFVYQFSSSVGDIIPCLTAKEPENVKVSWSKQIQSKLFLDTFLGIKKQKSDFSKCSLFVLQSDKVLLWNNFNFQQFILCLVSLLDAKYNCLIFTVHSNKW